MARWAARLALFAFFGAVAFAHGGYDHVRGVVTKISAQSISLQVADNSIRTLTLTDKTSVQQGTSPAKVADIKVGDRVVIDVPEKKAEAVLIKIGSAKAAPAKTAPAAKP
jgi:hypothetical protein